jgi:indole-3-glycerol phosphate synthase
MTVLDEIILGVREDMERRRTALIHLQEMAAEVGPTRNPLPSLRSKELSVIAEVKRSSPSKGELAQISDPAALAKKYEIAGASVVSVLTEQRRFGGSLRDLVSVRHTVSLPVLRKDFMVDEYQFHEARAYGADLVLLIVTALSQSQLKDFYALATELGMCSLVEVHSLSELERALEISPEIVGVNARNLHDLSIDQGIFQKLLPLIPNSIVKVAESGISTREDVILAQQSGANALLIGEALVRGADPVLTMRTLLGQG